jgi:Cu(I)/Ag(I) efflux system membrane protein CusA/SilA
VPLEQLSTLVIRQGPPLIKSENSRPNATIQVDLSGVDIGTYVSQAQALLERELELPAGYTLTWSGQYEYMQRAAERLRIVVPLALSIIFLLLFLNFRGVADSLIIMLSLPFALIGGFWLIFLLGYDTSVAVWVGFLALAGVSSETGVIMVLFLREAVDRYRSEGRLHSRADLAAAIYEGAVLRVRPKIMTVTAIMAGLLPIMWGTGTGSETMRRIAAPMVGGMVSAAVLTLIVIPVVFELVHGWRLPPGPGEPAPIADRAQTP